MNESYASLILSSFIGGVILNFMPCVLPVLAIKFYSLAKRSAHERHKEGWLYSAGVMTTFLILGGAFLALRLVGEKVGWGYQLQSPIVIISLIFLFWLLGFYFLGTLQMGDGLMNYTSGYLHDSGSFMTGALSVFVAAPCTGPFMGSALGAAALLPPLASLAIFASLGLGLCSPFLIFSLLPGLASRLPKPGLWMERLKEFFAFPMFATSVWLAWVLEQQIGPKAWMILSCTFLGLTFCLWLGKTKHKSIFIFSILLAFGVLGESARLTYQKKVEGHVPAPSTDADWKKYSSKLVRQLRDQHKSVFVDFTASWCVTCQVNKKTTLDLDSTMSLFRQHDTQLLVADWTDEDPEITQALSEFGRNSVPLYVYYAPDKEPVVLPQILTYDIMQNLYQ